MLHRRTSFAVLGAAALPALFTTAQAQTQPQSRSGANDLHMMAIVATTFSLNSSRMAMQKASNPMVRQFATLEVSEQEAAIVAMGLAGIAMPANVSMPADKVQMTQMLDQASGAAFDTAYLRGQKLGHEELLQIHSRIASTGASPAERIIGTMAVPAIRSHLAMIEMMMAR